MTEIVTIVALVLALIAFFAPLPDSTRRVLGAGSLGLALFAWLSRDEPDEAAPTLTVPEENHEETDEKTTELGAHLDAADVDAHDGAGTAVSDALDLLEERDADR